ncbi:MAG: hypothetical protein WCK64_09325 [Synechococcaceae cyanobacterium ELA445]
MNQARERPTIRRGLGPWLAPWAAPAPWLALLLLALAAASSPPRLWFWVALLVVVLLVGWVQALSSRDR